MAAKQTFEAGTYQIQGDNGKCVSLRFGKTVDRAMVVRLARARAAYRLGCDEFNVKQIKAVKA